MYITMLNRPLPLLTVINHLKGPASIRNRLSFYYSFIKDHVIFAWPKNPLQFAILYILYIFYITFNKRKKWESGPRCPQTLVLPRFRWPGFENKSGPRAKKKWAKIFFRTYKFQHGPNKSGPNPFSNINKWAKKKRGCGPRQSIFQYIFS